jgi:hypothetical protein
LEYDLLFSHLDGKPFSGAEGLMAEKGRICSVFSHKSRFMARLLPCHGFLLLNFI